MAAQTFTHAKASSKAVVPSGVLGGVVLTQFCKFVIPETPEVGDIYQFFRLPNGAVPVGGYMSCTDIDTGTETLELDVGIAANGVDDADPDFFTNSGVLTGDPITDFPFTNATSVRLFTGPFPVEQLGAETIVQGQVIALAAAGATGTVYVRVDYTYPGKPTS